MKVHHLVVAATTAALSFGALAGAQQQSQSERSGAVQAPSDSTPQVSSDDAAVIREAQDQLRAAGYPATPDGVREFQQAKGIAPSGQLDAQTLAALGVGASAASGASSEDGTARN